MPYQSRGFWRCGRCDRLFDDYHETTYHESLRECIPVPLHSQQQQQQHPQQQQQQPLPLHPAGNIAQGLIIPRRSPNMEAMPSVAAAAASAAYHHSGALPPPHAASQIPRREIPTQHRPPPPHHPHQQQQYAYQSSPRFLFGGNDTSGLTDHDSVAVRNVEAFAVDHSEYRDPSFGSPNMMGIVGIRCIHCIGTDTGPRSVVFPRSLHEVGDCVREVAEWHLGKCHRATQSVHQILEAALQRRHKRKAEGGNAWFQEEQDRSKLQEYCASRCAELRLVERNPPQSGIVFSFFRVDTANMMSFEESKQQTRSDLEEPFDPADIPFDDDLNPEPFIVSDQPPSAPDIGGGAGGGYDNMPTNFPFFREPSGDWICKFCQHVHPQFRDPQNRWAASHRSSPPAHFIDFHLNHCRMYQQSLLQDYRGPPNPSVLPNSIRTSSEARPAAAAASVARARGAPAASVAASRPGARTPPELSSFSGPQSPQKSAIAYLEANDFSGVDTDGSPLPPDAQLVQDDDRLLLTDYFYYLFKQLRLCRFSETDRKTRGGKRQAIKIGYGGLQCVHCAGQQNPRKFFWANVDRIANSFAEMPNHILKCRHCPAPTRDALLTLKETHAQQMTRLPRGSQKVFLRRMWRRLHKNDPKEANPEISPSASRRKPPPPAVETASLPPEEETPRPPKVARKQETGSEGSPGTNGSEGTIVVVERSTEEAAKSLVYAAMQAGPPSPSSRVLLSTPDDKQWLSDNDCFVRKQIEVFCATREDVELAHAEKKTSVQEGQVGIRCIHCSLSKRGPYEGGGVYYPFSINAVYDAVREFQRLHLDTCTNVPQEVRDRLAQMKGASSLSSVLRNYFQMSAKCIGLVDTKDGIRATGKNEPLQSQEFTFTERKSPSREGKGRKREAEEGGEK